MREGESVGVVAAAADDAVGAAGVAGQGIDFEGKAAGVLGQVAAGLSYTGIGCSLSVGEVASANTASAVASGIAGEE